MKDMTKAKFRGKLTALKNIFNKIRKTDINALSFQLKKLEKKIKHKNRCRH